VLSVKPPVTLDTSETVSLAEVERLVALGPEKGKYFLADCRPAQRFQEGNIPTAVNMPFPAFDKIVAKLPADKSTLIIYYCSGKTCNMSPGSLRKAQKLGYTNVKVFVDGMPGWYAKHHGVVAPASFNEVFLAKDNPAVVLDLRGAEAEKGALKGAVAVNPAKVAELLKAFPNPKVKPPVLVVDADGGAAAQALAAQIVKAGYTGVNVLQGGFKAWQAAGLPVVQGPLAAEVVFVPKPRPGSLPGAEFTRIASLDPAQREATILDVRNADETKNGVIKGAVVIPEPQLIGRLADVPKDKKVIVHCSTGIRAELAYHLLKEKGYDAAFLNAEIAILDTGEFVTD
jgi:rhodanese-related sulfurtransferase